MAGTRTGEGGHGHWRGDIVRKGGIAAGAALGLFLLSACALTPDRAPDGAPAPVALQILAVNDFHGHLEPPPGGHVGADGARIPAGGAEHLATALQTLREGRRHSITVGAGDLIGASPLLSALFHDEPTALALTRMGLALSAVGNHEFDEGAAELRRIQNGGCHPADGCGAGEDYPGAGFRYLAAGAVERATGETVFPPYEIREFDGTPVGFIGLTLAGTPNLIAARFAAEMTFHDEAETVNALVPQLQAQGVRAIVVMIHEGGYASDGPQGCGAMSGPIADILGRLDREVDIVVTGHTHQAYICEIDGVLVTSGGQHGLMATEILATLDPASGDIAAASARNIVTAHADYAADPAQTALLDLYRRAAAPAMARVAGHVAAPLSRAANDMGESPLGGAIADAQLAAGAGDGARMAFMNPGGVRADIVGAADGTVMFSELYAVQPFNNGLVAMTLTGAQIAALLEEQSLPGQRSSMLQVSAGVSYVWDADAAIGARARDVTLHGAPLDPDADYRIVVNDYLAGGGDGFATFAQGRDVTPLGLDIDALAAWFATGAPLSPRPPDRIRPAS